MAAINSTRELAKIRAKIDIQQQIVSQLESELQMVIIGDNTKTLGNVIDEVQSLYAGAPDGAGLAAAFEKGNDQLGSQTANKAEQHIIRNMLSQARSLLGELRVEEQGWNQEVNEEKARRKDLTDLAKG